MRPEGCGRKTEKGVDVLVFIALLGGRNMFDLLYATHVGKKILIGVWAVFTLLGAIFAPITLLIDLRTAGPEFAKENYLIHEGLFRSQGMATDGEAFFFSSRGTLIKANAKGTKHLAENLSALPAKLQKDYGSAHIGGISYYNGKVYAGVEDSKKWKHPLVVVYDAETLAFSGEFYELDPAVHTRGLPWVSVDPESGLLYAMDHSVDPKKLLAYNIEGGMTLAAEIPLNQAVPRVQGGDFYKGMLYVSTQDETQSVYRIDPKSGAAEAYFARNLAPGSEAEGMTVSESPDGPVFHVMDMGPLFINAFVRHYHAPEE